MRLILSILLGVCCQIRAVTIGSEALVSLPEEAKYSSAVNIRPGNGDTVLINPPVMSWFYSTNIATQNSNTIAYFEFQFQVSTNSAFTNNIVNKRTPSNLYNTLAPFTNANGSHYTSALYWRVGHIATNGGLSTNFYTATNSFTISASATNWDRSMLGDDTYLASKDFHPRIFFNSTNRADAYAFAQTNVPADWSLMMTRYSNATNAAWWTDSTAWQTNNENDVGAYALGLGSAMTYWALSQSDTATNQLTANYDRLVTWFLGYQYQKTDYGDGNDPLVLHCLLLGYDWLYPILTTAQKTNALNAIQQTARVYNRGYFWSTENPTGAIYFDPSGSYSSNRLVGFAFAPRTGVSHVWMSAARAAIIAAVAYGEGGDAREFYDLWINYMIGRGHFQGGFAAINQGRGYAPVHIVNGSLIWNTIALMSAFPESQLNRSPYLTGASEWLSRITPPGYFNNHDTYGDGGYAGALATYWNALDFKHLALLTQDGKAWLQHTNQIAFGASSAEIYFYRIAATYPIWTALTPASNTTAKAFLEDGWVTASTKPANAKDAFTNGLGFIFTARPRGTEGGHSINCDGAVELWAYGAKVTDAGGFNLDPYGYRPEAQDTLFVNGQGVKVNAIYSLYSSEQILPWYARIAAYTNSANFTYAMGDITPAFTNGFNPEAGNVLKVKRHILFSRTGKYFMLYDELATRTNAYFDWQWHVHEAGVTNISATGFRYSATNRAGQIITNHVFHATSGLEYTNMTGTNVLRNPRTGIWYSDSSNPNRWANSLWFRNAVQSTNHSFLSVIVPQEIGEAAPTFTRVDNRTAIVTYDGVTETNSFNSDYAGAATYSVSLAGGLGAAVSTLTVSNLIVTGSVIFQ